MSVRVYKSKLYPLLVAKNNFSAMLYPPSGSDSFRALSHLRIYKFENAKCRSVKLKYITEYKCTRIKCVMTNCK